MPRHIDQDEDIPDASAKRAAMTELYQRYAPALLVYLRHHTASIEDAEDVLLESFTTALGQERLLALPELMQRMWLWRVAKNKLADMYRQRGRRFTTPLEEEMAALLMDDELAPEQILLRQEEYTRLHQAVRQLSPLQQEALHLRFAQNLRCGEMGTLLGKSEKAIRSMLARTLNHLRSMYGTGQEDEDHGQA